MAVEDFIHDLTVSLNFDNPFMIQKHCILFVTVTFSWVSVNIPTTYINARNHFAYETAFNKSIKVALSSHCDLDRIRQELRRRLS